MKLPSVNQYKKKAACGYLAAVLQGLGQSNDRLVHTMPQRDEKPSIP